ncbi:MAG: ATP-binding protein, partial [Oscillospiraceae bacterium]|nr:ATP-binding protein [Oscillospiraceae bacterium]
MLQLLLGVSGTGKSTRIMEEIRGRAKAGKQSILLVPEQFTSSTESRIYRQLGDELSGFVSSYSFTSLSEKLLGLYGGAAIKTVTDASRVVMVRRAMEALGEQVHYYSRHRRSPAFLKLCADTLNELKSAGLTGLRLEELARGTGQGREKLEELAAIFAAYEAVLGNTAMDPGDRVALSAEKALAHPEFFTGKAVFIDEFDTFDAAK